MQYFKSFFHILLFINGLCLTIDVIEFSYHFISINHQTTFYINIKYIPMKTQQHALKTIK